MWRFIWQQTKEDSLLPVKCHFESWLICIYFLFVREVWFKLLFQFDVSCFLSETVNFHLKKSILVEFCYYGVFLVLWLDRNKRTYIHKLWWLQVKFGIRWSLLIFRIKNVQMVDLFLLLLICISWFCFFCCWFASSYMELFPVSCNCSHFFCAQSPCSFKIYYEKCVYPYIFSSHLSLTRHVRGM